MDKIMYAAIGTDGTREVVWGIGRTELAALNDAQAYAQDVNPELSRTVRISETTEELIRGGQVDCESLGI